MSASAVHSVGGDPFPPDPSTPPSSPSPPPPPPPPPAPVQSQLLASSSSPNAVSMNPDTAPAAESQPDLLQRLNPHRDARAIVRLLQCPICSLPFRSPVTLPCGNTCCRQCLPASHLRENISFSNANRQQGIACPFRGCREEHPAEECSANVVLCKIMDAALRRADIFRQQRDDEAADWRHVLLDEVLTPSPATGDGRDSLDGHNDTHDPIDQESEKPPLPLPPLPEKARTRSAKGSRLLATLDFALAGHLHISSEVHYEPDETRPEDAPREALADDEMFESLKEAASKEVECNVCYHPMLEPTTTPCGHTFCRKCLARVLDYSSSCPECRRTLFLPSSLSRQPHNKSLAALIDSFYPDQVEARRQALLIEESSTPEGLDTPLFPCTVAFPGLKTFLHIFEPRYRLMIRRCIESNGQFGIMAYNRFLEPQGELGRTQFMHVGTMLKIEQYSILEDGRSIIECKGLYRFKVRSHGMLDGYIIGNVEKLDDMSLADEEELEARETTLPPATDDDTRGQIERMSTSELCDVVNAFIGRARQSSSGWIRSRVLETYGEAPGAAAQLPYWVAAVLPLADEEKYRVLPTSSVRERLKLTVRWIHRIESQRWYEGSACNVL